MKDYSEQTTVTAPHPFPSAIRSRRGTHEPRAGWTTFPHGRAIAFVISPGRTVSYRPESTRRNEQAHPSGIQAWVNPDHEPLPTGYTAVHRA